MNNEILYRAESKVATITINRPESYNSITTAVFSEMVRAFEYANNDSSVKCIVLTGKGKAFSSGAHLAKGELEAALAPETLYRNMKGQLNPFIRTITRNQKPVIAAVNGPCAGVMAGIALACDLIIASESAYFLFPFVNIGLSIDGGPGYFLTRLIGPKKGMELLLLGERVNAKQALALGMINKVVPSDTFDEEINSLSKKLAYGPYSQSLIKNLVNQALDMTLDDYLDIEAEYQYFATGSKDAKEGINAFIEKRKPRFESK